MFDGVDVVNAEREDVSVMDCIDYSVGVEFFSECLLCCFEAGVFAASGVYRKDWRSGESEEVVVGEVFYDCGVHFAELASVAFVED